MIGTPWNVRLATMLTGTRGERVQDEHVVFRAS